MSNESEKYMHLDILSFVDQANIELFTTAQQCCLFSVDLKPYYFLLKILQPCLNLEIDLANV